MASILIIDDDVTVLSHIGLQLEAAGFQVAKSSDLGHAEQLYVEQRPDLVILEVRSANGKGWDLLGRLVAETPVLVLSAAAQEEEVVRALEEGAIDFIAKPYRSAELLARVRLRIATAQVAPTLLSLQAPTLPAPAKPSRSEPAPLPVEPPKTESSPAPVTSANVGATTPLSTTKRTSRRGPPSDEAVFMSEAEEMALLRLLPSNSGQPPSQPPALDLGDGGLGRNLRAERLRRHLTLVQIENEIKIRISYLQAMEDEKFTLLPRGPAAPQMVKDYAHFLGIEPGSIIDELKAQSQSEIAAPPPALGGVPPVRSFPRWVVILLAVLLALAVCVGAIMIFDPSFFERMPNFFQGLWVQST